MIVVHKFPAKLSAPAETSANAILEALVHVWNTLRGDKFWYYQEWGTSLSYPDLCSRLKARQNEGELLASTTCIFSQTAQQMAKRLSQSFKAWLKGDARCPRYKKDYQLIEYPQAGWGIIQENSRFYLELSKIGKIEFFPHRKFDFKKVKRVYLRKDSDTAWSVGLVYDDKLPPQGMVSDAVELAKIESAFTVQEMAKLAEIDKLLQEGKLDIQGYDWGVSELLTDAEGIKTLNPKFIQSSADKVASQNRKLAKATTALEAGLAVFKAVATPCAKDWRALQGLQKRVRTAKRNISRTWEDIANAKKDFLHKLSLALVRKHDVLVLEKLSTREMLEKAPWKSLVKRLTDGLHSQLITYCSYKAVRHGTLLWMINPRNTSRECSECHSINYRLGMKPGKWHCPHCGSVHDRNHNAGINIKARGLTSLSATLMGLFGTAGEHSRCPAF